MEKSRESAHLPKQFYQWVVKWFYGNVPEDTSNKPDIPSIICLLQAAGFKLCQLEKRDEMVPMEEPVKSESVRVTIECGSSSIVGILEMDAVNCECSNNNKVTDGSFWSISGTGPMASTDNVNKIEETGSYLLPEMSKEATALVRDVAYRLFKIINSKGDPTGSNKNVAAFNGNDTITKSTEGLTRSYTDYYDKHFKSRVPIGSNFNLPRFNSTISIKGSTEKVNAGSIGNRAKVNRQGTFDLDKNEEESIEEPRPSPPKIASSPRVIKQLCTSLGQISMQSDEEMLGLADYVVKAHQILDKAVNFIMKKIPINSSQSSIQDDGGSFIKPEAPGPQLLSSSFCASSPSSRSSGRGTLAGSMINRSLSNASNSSSASSRFSGTTNSSRPTSAASSAASGGGKGVSSSLQKPLTRRSVAGGTSGLSLGLPPMRDRSSSYGMAMSAQRQQQGGASLKNLAASARSRTTSTPGGGIAQRTASVGSKLPSISKLATSKTNANNTLTLDRPANSAKRRLSPSSKTPQTPSPARTNVSLIKAPTVSSRYSGGGTTSKFGYAATKK